MKNIKKVLACVSSIVTLFSISFTPTNINATGSNIDKDDINQEDLQWYEENAITEAIFIVEDENGECVDTYCCSIDVFPNNNYIRDLSDFPKDFDFSKIENVITITPDPNVLSQSKWILIDRGSCYTWTLYEYDSHDWTESTTTINKNVIIGESSEPSEETLQRGDVNGDGKINVLDLLQLKKYILKIIDTLE